MDCGFAEFAIPETELLLLGKQGTVARDRAESFSEARRRVAVQ
jgi:hypothetical protein